MFKEGQFSEFSFSISSEEMAWFAENSGDKSHIHVNDKIARQMGFDGVIVYGGLMLLRVSRMVGEHLPGKFGVSAKWEIEYKNPLYVGEKATIRSEVVSFSEAMNYLNCKFVISANNKIIAKGKTFSIVKSL